MPQHAFSEAQVDAVFAGYAEPVRTRLLALRELIFATAAETDGVGQLIETLKWGQPAYLTERPRTGSTLRIDALKGTDTGYAMFVHCQTTLVSTYREIYPDTFRFDGNRALLFSADLAVPEEPLKHCIALALTYHRRR